MADSDPIDEQIECENKVEALHCAIDRTSLYLFKTYDIWIYFSVYVFRDTMMWKGHTKFIGDFLIFK